MKPTTVPPATRADKKDTRDKEFSFKDIAMGGPGLCAIVHASDFRIAFVNRQFEFYLHYSNDDIAQEPLYFTELFDGNQVDRLIYQLHTVADTIEAQSRYVVYQLKDKNGVSGAYYLYAAPALNSNGKPLQGGDLYYFTLHPNLSRWDIPFSSFVTRELFLEHFNAEDFGTFEWILGIDKVFLSEGLRHVFEVGHGLQEVEWDYIRSFVHPADRVRFENEIKQSIATDKDLVTDFRIVTADQKVKIAHCIGRTMKSSDGKPVKFAGSIRDITSQRNIEEDLKNKVTELYHSNKELEEFAYIASHDMQEPLRKITVFSDRLSEKYKDVLTGDGAMYLSRMTVAAENMRLLIDGLLEFSRITKTRQSFEPTNLNDILQEVKTDLELVIEETGATINSQLLPTVDAVPSQMKQLLANIVGNAIKFRKADVSPVITIESKLLSPSEITNVELAKNTDYFKISIADNGVGFEEEYAIRIFQVFQRLHGKSEYPGSGIGLAICKKILEYHKGVIFAESVPEKGARFTFILPAHQSPKENTV